MSGFLVVRWLIATHLLFVLAGETRCAGLRVPVERMDVSSGEDQAKSEIVALTRPAYRLPRQPKIWSTEKKRPSSPRRNGVRKLAETAEYEQNTCLQRDWTCDGPVSNAFFRHSKIFRTNLQKGWNLVDPEPAPP